MATMTTAGEIIARYQERYYTAAEWEAMRVERQAVALALMDPGDLFTQARLLARERDCNYAEILGEWVRDGLLGDVGIMQET